MKCDFVMWIGLVVTASDLGQRLVAKTTLDVTAALLSAPSTPPAW